LLATPKTIPNLSFSMSVEVSIKSDQRASGQSWQACEGCERPKLGVQASCLPSVRSALCSRLAAFNADKMSALPA
jgi:hypothetical protein